MNIVENEYYDALFKKMDANSSGFLTMYQVYYALVEVGVILDSKAVYDIARLICDFQVDKLDMAYFSKFFYVCENTYVNDIPGMLFYAADSNRAGYIYKQDLGLILRKLNVYITDGEIYELVGVVENDGRISYQMYCYLIDEIMNQ